MLPRTPKRVPLLRELLQLCTITGYLSPRDICSKPVSATSSKPGNQRGTWRSALAISCGSRLACRSRGTANSSLPLSAVTVLWP